MRTSAVVATVAVAVVAGCGGPTTDAVDPARELPVLVRFVHGHGGEDLISVGPDGVVTGWLGGQDGDRPVGCLAELTFVRALAAAAAEDLEPGATEPEPEPEGADFEAMEVTGRSGTGWLGDGGNEAVRLAGRLVDEVHLAASNRTLCRETPATSPGAVADGVVLRRWSGPTRYADAVVVSTTGAVTGRTRDGVVACEVPRATAEVLRTAPVPEVALPDGGGDVPRLSVRRGGADHPLLATSTDSLTTTTSALLDDLQPGSGERTVCTPRQ